MKRISRSAEFKRQYKERIARNDKLKQEFWEAVSVFEINPEAVRDHALERRLTGYKAFSITGEYRVVYRENDEEIIFLRVGTHEQVYGR